jgi:L-asparaginase/Glu-tRNA(Gln) amidotransferase subunit D
MKKRVLIIYTGGTIGMKKTEKGYALTPEFVAQIQQAAHKAVAELGLTVE